ncbi:hypothetical protein PFICI_14433 [Pestalotiopsis fici W106-1]|uniref:Uncharacterized protein n=1 Tax=Pestalotiopsis fici (strain W106-1 / CGMCC3.15140) TaxID=1229662 RepID=W3WK06_PESFW|nr:uncharacterized protein PFICI_14433 [Pestalotiopsis fici W106-1]ETS73487.1 hypothetical protein PFICI_14433 [Pestalotiopsis fici W106-1]
MFKSIASLALLASSVAVSIAGPLPDIDPRDLAEPMPLVAREFELNQLQAREPEDFALEDRDLEARAGKTINAVATFDTLVAGGNTLTRAIGNYGALQWSGINVVKVGTNNLFGVNAYSKPNVAVYGAITNVLSNVPTIKTQYSGSKTASFSIDSFYFGCNAGTALTLVAAPTDCRLAIAGYDKSSKVIAYQSFIYRPAVAVTANMIKAQLNAQFKAPLDHVVILTSYSVGILGATLIDNFNYTVTAV